MIEAIDRKDIPPQGGRERSPMRQFALGAVGEFLEVAQVGDVYEVTGWPDVPAETALHRAAKAVSAIDKELWHAGAEKRVKVYRRRERVFLEYKEPYEVKPARNEVRREAPRPYVWPDDFPASPAA